MLKRRKKSLSEYSTGELVMFRFRKNKLAMFGVFLLAFVFLAVLAAPILSSYENVTKLHISDRFTSPNPLYIFGTDEFAVTCLPVFCTVAEFLCCAPSPSLASPLWSVR